MAKTLALAVGARLVAVPSTRVLAENGPAEARHLLIVLDARRGSVFAGRYERVDGIWVEREPAHLDRFAEALGALLPDLSSRRGAERFHSAGRARHRRNAARSLGPNRFESCQAGGADGSAGSFITPDALAPLYLRQSEAEEKWANREDNSSGQ